MRKKAAGIAVMGALGALTFGAPTASAAHCVEGDSPGFSYYGNDHVAQQDAHGGSPEGGNPGPHAGTSGASNCRETTGSPSERAPGRNK
jgi:hypothetical protein